MLLLLMLNVIFVALKQKLFMLIMLIMSVTAKVKLHVVYVVGYDMS